MTAFIRLIEENDKNVALLRAIKGGGPSVVTIQSDELLARSDIPILLLGEGVCSRFV